MTNSRFGSDRSERLHTLRGRKVAGTDAAILWEEDDGTQMWWPTSQCVEIGRDRITVTDWIWNEKGRG